VSLRVGLASGFSSLGETVSVQIDLSSDVAVVTGGGNGVGAGIAILLAQAGARVAVLDASSEAVNAVAEEINSDGRVAMAVVADIVDEVGVRRALAQVLAQLGPVSVLVNNAGIRTIKKFAETTAEETARVVGVTLFGTLTVVRVVLPDLLLTQGRIVNIASDSARAGAHSMSLSAGADAGVVAVTKSLAKEVGRNGVRANVVVSGTTVTPGGSSFMEQPDEADKLARAHPLGRLGTPADIAGAVLFLTSPLSAWITGQVLSVNGGYTMV
jgi:NAD(P)-dependent dehydrogenase (short-subunit alcohol dehydrogenase family)